MQAEKIRIIIILLLKPDKQARDQLIVKLTCTYSKDMKSQLKYAASKRLREH